MTPFSWSPILRKQFARDPKIVARFLLGKVLVRKNKNGSVLSGRIVEAEAYLGQGDLAAHAAAGKTERNAVLFGPPGHAYVYFTYGMHYCMNVSCQPEGEAGCVLLRALEPMDGVKVMARRRGVVNERMIASGPARLCQAFGITRMKDNGKDLCSPGSDLILADDGFRAGHILTTPRIGIRKSPALRLRFLLAGNPYVSR